MQAGCEKRKYKPLTIAKRVGKLLGKNSRAPGLFEVDIKQRADGGTEVVWKKVAAGARLGTVQRRLLPVAQQRDRLQR